MLPESKLTAALTGRYNVLREIGAGGMATVYLARDLRHDRPVALKILRADVASLLGVDRFLSEIRVTANLQHPNLLPLFDSGEVNGSLFYVMPFIEGESLRARLDREKQLPVDEAIAITVAIANGLEYAHSHGVIHRDLKPENVLMQAGQPMVADFGIALATGGDDRTRITETGLSLGTPRYMSPEQATGDRKIDKRSDVYSLGAMFYEMLTGETPHTGSTSQAVIARILTEAPRSVRATRPSVSRDIDASVMRALEKTPADRWPSADAFAVALRAGLDSLNVDRRATESARLASTAGRSERWKRTWSRPAGILAGLAMVAVIAFVALRFGFVGRGTDGGSRRGEQLAPSVGASNNSQGAAPPVTTSSATPKGTTGSAPRGGGDAPDATLQMVVASELYKQDSVDAAVRILRRIGGDKRFAEHVRLLALDAAAQMLVEAGTLDSGRAVIRQILDFEPPLVLITPEQRSTPIGREYDLVRKERLARLERRPKVEQVKSVFVVPFQRLAGGIDYEGVETALQDLLMTDLSGVKGIKLLDRSHIQEITERLRQLNRENGRPEISKSTSKVLKGDESFDTPLPTGKRAFWVPAEDENRIASHTYYPRGKTTPVRLPRASHVLTGSFVIDSNKVVMSAWLFSIDSATVDAVAVVRARSEVEQLLGAIGELSKQIVAQLRSRPR